jgi:predicted RNA-binding protein with PUA-like domain
MTAMARFSVGRVGCAGRAPLYNPAGAPSAHPTKFATITRHHFLVTFANMAYWLIKSEPGTYGIDHMARDKKTWWNGVRNYQARNFMRDGMKVGDRAFFYHSNCDEPGIVGIVEVSSPARPDETQFDRKSHYYDAASKREEPRWLNVEFKFVKRTPLVTLDELRKHKPLANMRVLQRGNRLSITPVEPKEWDFIVNKLMDSKG